MSEIHKDDTQAQDEGVNAVIVEEGREDERGFSLIEMMVVIVIIGLLATIVMINVLPNQERAMSEKARADIAQLESALEMFRLSTLRYPTTDEGLEALVSAPADRNLEGRYPEGGFINRLPEDPWGNPYQYLSPGEHNPRFDIYSLGADGRAGGDGRNADIGNWNED
ncbi:type II secretion system major pseudopilin GspG [Woodsholea maritima]|uniref:type II secretion system major pseudopilin GspG n=1 Tax=Woodsholea maritima TaxID=240237 RepID=UPI0003823028|nr:type II secretion system major pseudopilin GspG [Woodsholea maritima]